MKVGVDIGTTVTKAVLFGSEGDVLHRRSARTPLLRPAHGHYEYDVEQLVDSVLDLLRDFPAREIELIALTGQGDGLWLLDERARAVRPALAWLDARGAPVCETWSENGALTALFGRTRNAPFPGAGAALLAALERTDPGSIDAAHTATQCQHVLFERLTGTRTATRSCAMLPVFDPAAGDYDDEAIRLAGLDRRRHLLPDIADAPAVAAPLRDSLADALGLTGGLLVATGPYDLPAAALGVGTLAAGDGLLILGTTLACEVMVERIGPPGPPVGLTLCTGDDEGWLRAMPAMVGTACLDWVLTLVGRDLASLGRLLAASPPGANGVAALPYLSPAGERAPFADPAARAELTGLTIETTSADVVRAVCEALAYAARQCFEAAGLTGDVVVCGGGATSPDLVQLFADILERPVTVAPNEEPAARGAVVAAGGSFAMDPIRPTVHPRKGKRWSEGYADFVHRQDIARRHGWRRGSPTRPREREGRAWPSAAREPRA